MLFILYWLFLVHKCFRCSSDQALVITWSFAGNLYLPTIILSFSSLTFAFRFHMRIIFIYNPAIYMGFSHYIVYCKIYLFLLLCLVTLVQMMDILNGFQFHWKNWQLPASQNTFPLILVRHFFNFSLHPQTGFYCIKMFFFF